MRQIASLLGIALINLFYILIKFLDEITFFLKIFCHKFLDEITFFLKIFCHKFLDEITFFLKIFCHKFENIFVIKCKKIEIKKVKFNFWD